MVSALRDELARDGSAEVRIRGNSMWPFYRDGEVVSVVPARVEDLRVGDVVVVRLPDHVVCHRVFRMTGGGIQTKADDSPLLDPPAAARDLIGKIKKGTFYFSGKRKKGTFYFSRRSEKRVCPYLSGYLISRLTLITSRVYPSLGVFGKMILRAWERRRAARAAAEANRAIIALLKKVGTASTFPERDPSQESSSHPSYEGKMGTGNFLLRKKVPSPHFPQKRVCPYFLKRVFAEGVSGLVYHRGAGPEAAALPEGVREELQRDFMRTMGRNMLLREHLREIMEGLRSDGLRAVLLRGENLLGRMYPSPGVKAATDIDILVRSGDWERTRKVLEGLGYAASEPYPYVFWRDHVPVDVHLDSASFWKNGCYRFPIDLRRADVWENAVPADESFPDIRLLSAYDSVLLCCVHAQEHGFDRMITMLDAAALVTSASGGFDWGAFVERARALGLERPAYFTMRFLSEKGLLSVPAGVLAAPAGLGAVPLGRFERRSLARLLDDRRPPVNGGLLYLLSIRGTTDRLRFLRGAVFPSRRTGPGSRALRPFKLLGSLVRS